MLTRLAALLLVLASFGCNPAVPGNQPTATNLLWISLDTLRADRLGCYGYSRDTTPTLDQLAAGGALFEDAHAPSPWTMPSHAAMFTGLYPSRSGVVSFTTELRPSAAHIAELLSSEGFQTNAVVSNHAITMHGLERGFDRFEYVERGRGAAPSDVTPVAIAQFRELDREKPFFALVHYNAVHARYRAQPKYTREFVGPYDGEISGRNVQFLEHVTGKRPFTDEDVAHLSELYDAALRQLDDQLSELFAYLEDEGLLERTLVVITSDHGEEFFDHGGVSHAMTQFQELVRVPLILFGPGVPAGRRIEGSASLIDLLPTSLRALGLTPPDGIDGIDLTSSWNGTQLPERLLYFESDCKPPRGQTAILDPGTKRAIRAGRFKLHLDLEGGGTALYDLGSDPEETLDVSADHPEVARELTAALKTFLESAPDSFVETELSTEQLNKLSDLGYVHGSE